MRTSIRRAGVIVPFVLLLAACGGSDTDPETDPAIEPADASGDAEDEPAESTGSTDDAGEEADGDGSEADAAADPGDCPDGPRELGGVSVVTFHCGTATADVTTSEGTSTLVGGTCETTDDTFAINFGTVVLDVAAVLDGTAPSVDYLGIAIHEGASADGTYVDHDMVTVVHSSSSGEDYTSDGSSVTLRDGRTAGEASTEGLTVAFDCG